jgi:DNA-directed RNA polymerase subunit RPC12/RpoP
MGDEMKFPNEIWTWEDAYGDIEVYTAPSQGYMMGHYIHESRVPISCGGTMEENDSHALARAEYDDDTYLRTDQRAIEKSILTNAESTQDRLDKYSQAEFADKILEIRKLRQRVDELEAKLGGGTMEEESFTRYCPIHKIGIHYVCSKCQEEKIFAICKTVLTSGSAEIECPQCGGIGTFSQEGCVDGEYKCKCGFIKKRSELDTRLRAVLAKEWAVNPDALAELLIWVRKEKI